MLLKYLFKLLIISLLLTSFGGLAGKGFKSNKINGFQLPSGVGEQDIAKGVIIFKLKEEYRGNARLAGIEHQGIREAFNVIGASEIRKKFPGKRKPETERNIMGKKLVDLSLIYQLNYDTEVPLEKAVNAILQTGIVEYAEPKYLPRLLYNPNDPNQGPQYFLNKIQAYPAWDISKGDTNVVIGITDTGTDTNHPDLEANIKYNYADPINGIDDDNDGYTDNFMGWDLGENDNNPQVNVNSHGAHVSGCAAAVTDNGVGVASPGFNCRFLPIKISNASGSLTEAYEGIVYAADHGCRIINCSWGGPGGSSFGQDIVEYATVNMNSLVIAAAGNDGLEMEFYPAAYDYVLSVASTTNSDGKSSFSNYGSWIDISAPGSSIYTANFNDTYSFSSGTSMACPVAAGAAGIILSHNPNFNALQIGEQLRVTSDNIYSIGGNFIFQDKLGTGRINLFRALTETPPGVRISNMNITDGNDDTFVIGDTISISGLITNYLGPATMLDITMTSTSPYINIIDNYHSVGSLGTLDSTDNHADPFKFIVNPGTPQNARIYLKLNISDLVAFYSDFQVVEVTVNVDYINVTINQVLTTITSKGRICYNGPSQQEGLGFQYSNDNLAYEVGLMIGSSSSKVSDDVRGTSGVNNDFMSSTVIQKVLPSVYSDFDLTGWFTDNNASSPIPITVRQNAYAWDDPGDDKYVIVEYIMHNTSGSNLSSIHAGIFADWDVMDFSLNRAEEDASLKMGYIYSTQTNGLFAGIKLLTPTPFIHYAIDNVAGQGGINMTDGYSTAEKFTSLTTNRPAAGQSGNGNDVIDVVSTGPFNIAAGDSVKVAFALIAGDDLTDLNSSAMNAQTKYDLITSISELSGTVSLAVHPNPVSDEITITGIGLISGNILFITDTKGRIIRKVEISDHETNQVWVGVNDLPSGMYFIRSSENERAMTKFIKL